MQLTQKDYLHYMKGANKWSAKDELLFNYLSTIITLLTQIVEELSRKAKIKNPNDMTEIYDLLNQGKKVNLWGQYKIQPTIGKGTRKGPPPIII